MSDGPTLLFLAACIYSDILLLNISLSSFVGISLLKFFEFIKPSILLIAAAVFTSISAALYADELLTSKSRLIYLFAFDTFDADGLFDSINTPVLFLSRNSISLPNAPIFLGSIISSRFALSSNLYLSVLYEVSLLSIVL